jgi:hypothetical protein
MGAAAALLFVKQKSSFGPRWMCLESLYTLNRVGESVLCQKSDS